MKLFKSLLNDLVTTNILGIGGSVARDVRKRFQDLQGGRFGQRLALAVQLALEFLDRAAVLSSFDGLAARRGRRSRPASRPPAPPDIGLARGTRRCDWP